MGFSLSLSGQQARFLGLNVAPLIIGGAELHGEFQVGPFLAVKAIGGFRYQKTDPMRFSESIFLKDYRQPQNVGVMLGVGARFFQEEGFERPFIEFMLSGIYVEETLISPDPSQPQGYLLSESSALLPAVCVTAGFEIYLAVRWRLDLALQASYASVREDVDSYYLPGAGYSTFGPGRFGITGLYAQPVVAIKFRINKDRRARLRQQP